MALQVIACPKCRRKIIPKGDGRCPSCQEKITEVSRDDPSPVPSSSGPGSATPSATVPSPSASQAATGGRVSKGYLVFGVLLVLVGTPLLAESILGDPRPAMVTTRRARGLENSLGPRATLFIAGVGTLAVGLYVTHASVRRATRRGRTVGYGLALGAVAVGASFIAVPKAVEARERGRLQKVVEEIRPLCETDSIANQWQKFPIGEKLIIWNCMDDDFHSAHEKLPDLRRGGSADRKVTFLLILRREDEKDTEYESGEFGYRRTLRIGLVDWPDKKLLGVFELEGDPPYSYLIRGKDDVSRIVGDTTAPMLRWIDHQTPTQ